MALLIILTLIFPLSLRYIIAVHYGHLTPFFPYISNTGGKPPESCIFTLICSISSIICEHTSFTDLFIVTFLSLSLSTPNNIH